MKINVELDMDDFYESFDGDTLAKVMSDELKAEIMKIVKRDSKYKAFVNKKAQETLDGLEI